MIWLTKIYPSTIHSHPLHNNLLGYSNTFIAAKISWIIILHISRSIYAGSLCMYLSTFCINHEVFMRGQYVCTLTSTHNCEIFESNHDFNNKIYKYCVPLWTRHIHTTVRFSTLFRLSTIKLQSIRRLHIINRN